MRTNTLGEIVEIGPFSVQAASPNRLYVGGTLFSRVNLDTSGVVAFDIHDGLLAVFDVMKLQAGLIFTRGGRVFNPETLEVLGYLPPSHWVEPDLATGFSPWPTLDRNGHLSGRCTPVIRLAFSPWVA